MSAPGIIGFDNVGPADMPSPSIWSDCPCEHLNESGSGTFVHTTFLAEVADTIASGEQRPTFGNGYLSIDCDDDTVTTMKASEFNGYLDLETDADDNDAWCLFTEPFLKIVPNSHQKVWFECRFEVGAVADQGLFIGVAEEAALARDLVADAGTDTDGESMIGFRLLSSDTDQLDFGFKLDAGTWVDVLADVTNASAIASGDRAAIAANTEVKVGFKFDGLNSIQAFVNGTKVATYTIDTSVFPNGVDMGIGLCLKTGSAAAVSAAFDWVRGAYLNTC